MKTTDIEKLKQMMRLFRRLHMVNVQAKTFMQLTNYPHLENVCSNILAFFFDTEEAHNFGNLFVKSLLSCVGISTGYRTTEAIERELTTTHNKRIDLYIETEKYLIVIENKVYSDVHNPFAEYEAFISESNIHAKEPVFILLTMREEKAEKSSFINVTYSDLFKEIRRNIGQYLVSADTKWTVILNDFIKSMEDLKMGAELNKDFIDFYNEFEVDIGVLIRAKKDLPKTLKGKIEAILNLLGKNELFDREIVTNNKDCIVECYFPCKCAEKIEPPIYLVLYIDTKVCHIGIGIEDATLDQMKLLEQALSEKKLDYKRWDEYSNYFILESFTIYEDIEVIAKALKEINAVLQ